MKKICLVTCSRYPQLTDDDALLVPALCAAGFDTQVKDWRDRGVKWSKFDLVIIRNTWDYFEYFSEFQAWLDELEAQRVSVQNPVEIMRGNLDKHYLRTLAGDGVSTVPTLWIEPGETDPAGKILAETNHSELVVKPAVSAGGYRTYRLRRDQVEKMQDELLETLEGSALMVQPLLTEILEEGEWSFVYFGKKFSHSVVKRAKEGDFRVQWTHGGTHESRSADPRILAQIQAIFAKIPGDRLYTRIDGVIHEGTFWVVEVELVEPYLFLGESVGAVDRFVAAVRALV